MLRSLQGGVRGKMPPATPCMCMSICRNSAGTMLRLAAGAARGSLRRMSTAALPKEAPVQMYGVAGRYTNALYAAAASKDELLTVEKDLKLFKETMASSAALRNFVIDPSISRTEKVAGVTSLCTESGACESTKNALSALAEGGRMTEVTKVIDMYSELLAAAKGELTAVITSAEPLKAGQAEEVVTALNRIVRARPGVRAPGLGLGLALGQVKG